MKNVSAKIIGAIGVVGIAAAIYSFTSDDTPDQPEFKKYEVIRMVNGEIMQHDTIVPSSSEYSPQDYLNDLGYGEDEKVSIIDLMNFQHPHCEMSEKHIEHHGDHEGDHKGEHMIFIEMNEDELIHEACILAEREAW